MSFQFHFLKRRLFLHFQSIHSKIRQSNTQHADSYLLIVISPEDSTITFTHLLGGKGRRGERDGHTDNTKTHTWTQANMSLQPNAVTSGSSTLSHHVSSGSEALLID